MLTSKKMLADVLLLLLGGLGLYYGAEWLVAGAARLARTLGVSPLAIGLTIVSYGTSAPELAVSLVAAVENRSAIALGNVIGSNIANIGLILGMTALIAPPVVDDTLRRRELPLMVAGTVALPIFLADGVLSRFEGAAFFTAACIYTLLVFRGGSKASDAERSPVPGKPVVLLALIAVGLVVLVGGGHAFVRGAVGIAQQLGMSDRMVGLTIVAVGTSLPELAASLVAALRGHSELAVGNVVGSNLFNLFLVLGIASLVHPIRGDLAAARLDLSVLGAMTIFCVLTMSRARKITRLEGALYGTAYAGFLVGLILVN